MIPQRRTNGLVEARECGSHWWQHWHSCRSLLETARLAEGNAFQQCGDFTALGSGLGESPEWDVIPPLSTNLLAHEWIFALGIWSLILIELTMC